MKSISVKGKEYQIGEVSVQGLVGDPGSPKQLIVSGSQGRQYAIGNFYLSEFRVGEKLTAVFSDYWSEPILLINGNQHTVYAAPFKRNDRIRHKVFTHTVIAAFLAGAVIAAFLDELTPSFVMFYFVFCIGLSALWDYRDKLSEEQAFREKVATVKSVITGEVLA